MTWARNFGDRYHASSSLETRRAKGGKICTRPGCDAGIDNRKTYCGPCSNLNHEERVAARQKAQAKCRQNV